MATRLGEMFLSQGWGRGRVWAGGAFSGCCGGGGGGAGGGGGDAGAGGPIW